MFPLCYEDWGRDDDDEKDPEALVFIIHSFSLKLDCFHSSRDAEAWNRNFATAMVIIKKTNFLLKALHIFMYIVFSCVQKIWTPKSSGMVEAIPKGKLRSVKLKIFFWQLLKYDDDFSILCRYVYFGCSLGWFQPFWSQALHNSEKTNKNSRK